MQLEEQIFFKDFKRFIDLKMTIVVSKGNSNSYPDVTNLIEVTLADPLSLYNLYTCEFVRFTVHNN